MKAIINLFTFLVATFLFASCSKNNANQYNDPIPRHNTFTITSKNLKEKRVINVWLPDNYETTKDSLAVVYMPDGGTEEDFPHVANTIADLIKKGKIQPVILVGIENIQRRKDLTPTTQVEEDKKVAPVVGGSSQFRSFIQDELFPEIDKRYRTKNYRAIIGESLAGLFIVETFLEHPTMFDSYIAIDPSLWWNNQYAVKTAKQNLVKLPKKPVKFWYASSDAKDIYTYTNQLEKILKDVNLSQLKWFYSKEPKEQHATIYKATKEKALIWSLGNK